MNGQVFSIYFWHGKPSEKELNKMGLHEFCTEQPDGSLYYKGTLDSFAEKYNKKFIFLPGEPFPGNPSVIAVTQYGNFGQR